MEVNDKFSEPVSSNIMLRFRRLFCNKISLLESDCFSFGSKDILKVPYKVGNEMAAFYLSFLKGLFEEFMNQEKKNAMS